MKKIVVSSLVSLFVLSCSVSVSNNSNQDNSLRSQLTGNLSLMKEDFSDIEKEYKSFSTKALSDAYVKRMFGKYLSPVNSVQLTRQLEFSRYLKASSDLTYETSLKSMFSQTPLLYDQMIAIGSISDKMSTESATFGTYVEGLSPYPKTPVATTATNITSNSFTANWNTTANATGYKLYVNGNEVYSGIATSFNVTGLSSGNHSYYVKATNNAGNSQNSNIITATLTVNAPGVPVATSATNITQTSFTANWNTVSGATSYKLYLNGNEVYSGASNSYNVTGLNSNFAYNYYVKAINAGGESIASNTIIANTLSSIVTSGLIVNLDAGNIASYSGTGTSWTDTAGNDHNATLYNGTSFNANYGGGIVFDGADDLVQYDLACPMAMTVTTVAKSNSSVWTNYAGLGIGRGQNGFAIHNDINNTELGTVWLDAGGLYFSTGNSYSPSNIQQPNFYTISTNGSNNHKIYLNGELIYTDTATQMNRTSSPEVQAVTLGSDITYGRFTNVTIYYHSVYNRQLGDSEVLQNYNYLKTRFGL